MVDPLYGRLLAYAGPRAVARKSTKDAVAHAVWELSAATGLVSPDSECGVLGLIPLGEWDPDYKHNCKECTKVLAGAPLPELERPGAAAEPVVEPTAVPVQLLLFDAA